MSFFCSTEYVAKVYGALRLAGAFSTVNMRLMFPIVLGPEVGRARLNVIKQSPGIRDFDLISHLEIHSL